MNLNFCSIHSKELEIAAKQKINNLSNVGRMTFIITYYSYDFPVHDDAP